MLSFIIVLGVLIFVHEFGHFVAARRSGMAVEEFGFGFPPRIVGIQRRNGRWHMVRRTSSVVDRQSTVYSLNWLPLGGFVRITGESGGDASDPQSFVGQPRWRRALVLAAGVAMNVVLAVVLFSTVYAVGARQSIDDLPASARIADRETTIVSVMDGTPAASAGFVVGDVITGMDGSDTGDADAVRAYVRAHDTTPIAVTVEREGVSETILVTPAQLPDSTQQGIGVHLVTTGIVAYPLPIAVWEGVQTTGFVMAEISRAMGSLVTGLLGDGKVSVDIAGPVGIAVLTGQVAQLGFIHLLQFTAVLSANLAFLNIFPFPALDGGRLLFLAIEAIRRRALSKRVEGAIHAVGFAVLMLLVLFVTYRDVVTFGGGILESLKGSIGL